MRDRTQTRKVSKPELRIKVGGCIVVARTGNYHHRVTIGIRCGSFLLLVTAHLVEAKGNQRRCFTDSCTGDGKNEDKAAKTKIL